MVWPSRPLQNIDLFLVSSENKKHTNTFEFLDKKLFGIAIGHWQVISDDLCLYLTSNQMLIVSTCLFFDSIDD